MVRPGFDSNIATDHIIHKAGFTKSAAHTGAVTLIQRFGSALNLNVHFHILALDGVYAEDAYGKMRFYRIKAPTADELALLTQRISQRVAKFLERRGFLERDERTDEAISVLEKDNKANPNSIAINQTLSEVRKGQKN